MPGVEARGGQEAGLFHLPLEILGLVDQYALDHPDRHPLLAVCRQGRDVILQRASAVRFSLSGSEAAGSSGHQADTRLLNRVCLLARRGLSLCIHGARGAICDSLLPALLQPGVEQGGWDRVHFLVLMVKNLSSSSQVQLIPAAFPALQRLVLSNTALADGSLLRHLQGCSQLTRLRLDCCQVDAGSEGSAAAALAQLPHLVSLTLKGSTPLSLASQLTGLLNLRLTDRQESVHDLFQVAAQCPELCSLTVRSNSTREQAVPAEQLRSLLGSCPSLTCLDMACHSIDQQGLEALLQLGPNITDLTLSSIQATRDLSGRECKWRWLTLDTQEACNVVYLANLPLRGVERLILNSEESVHLGLPVSAVPAPELPGLVRKAALNIASCPAWQKRPSPSLHLFTMATEPGSEPFWWAGLLPEVRIPILQALAPLGGPHMQLFSLSSRADGALAVGGAELRSLSSALGPGLNELLLDDNCGADHSAGILIEFDFWPALRTCFPALQGLLLRDVRGSVTEADLIMCSQASSRPITFSLSAGIMEGALDLDYLKSRLTVWGLTHVTLQQLPF